VFALSFCPVSAALFFGGLIPIALRLRSALLLPFAYGMATGLPVVVFGLLMAACAHRVGEAYDKLAVLERWARTVTGIVFVAIGVYSCLAYIFCLFS
jgi:threonine/homoserine/homoserine lactone efflux protein